MQVKIFLAARFFGLLNRRLKQKGVNQPLP